MFKRATFRPPEKLWGVFINFIRFWRQSALHLITLSPPDWYRIWAGQQDANGGWLLCLPHDCSLELCVCVCDFICDSDRHHRAVSVSRSVFYCVWLKQLFKPNDWDNYHQSSPHANHSDVIDEITDEGPAALNTSSPNDPDFQHFIFSFHFLYVLKLEKATHSFYWFSQKQSLLIPVSKTLFRYFNDPVSH